MENGGRFKLLFKDLTDALSSFEHSLTIDFTRYDLFETDLIQSGQIQKFEYTIELLWKTLKKYFEVKREMKIIYPKEVIKAYFLEEAITEETYLTLMDAIESRNLLSHIYKIELFDLIHPKLDEYAKAIRYAYTALEPNTI
jgi:nucleotidyltransferase substrate binding protein (TIGR01987 family)